MPQPPPKPWKKAIFRAIARTEHALRGGNLPVQADFAAIRNFLVLQYESSLGSVIHATPLFEALKREQPDCHIAVAASSMAASVLEHNPYVDRCVVTANPFENFFGSVMAVRRLLETMPAGPRCILTTIGNRSPRLAFLAMAAGSGIRVGHTAAPEFYNFPLTFIAEHGQIEGNLDIVRKLGYGPGIHGPRIFFTQKDWDTASQKLDALPVSCCTPRIVFVTQTSGGQLNQWSDERFCQVIEHLFRQWGANPVFVGTKAEEPAIEALRRCLSHSGASLAGRTTIPELAAVLAQCDLVVSLDTGTFHVARAVGLPGVVIAPAWQDSREWLPVGDPRYRVLRGSAIHKGQPDYWIEEIGVEQVLTSAQSLLEAFPASFEVREARRNHSLAEESTL
ncbi:MAG: glycosyltransferase family 9 protein [Acidobacteriaceae bacterium]